MSTAVTLAGCKPRLFSAPSENSSTAFAIKMPDESKVLHFPASSPTVESSSRISVVMRAVLFNMAETEQYFPSESRTASSTALRETFPETWKINLMAV